MMSDPLTTTGFHKAMNKLKDPKIYIWLATVTFSGIVGGTLLWADVEQGKKTDARHDQKIEANTVKNAKNETELAVLKEKVDNINKNVEDIKEAVVKDD